MDVDVSQWIANPSGTANELKVGVHPSASAHAHVKGGEHSTTITVDLTSQARAVPYTVTNTKYNITSTAFIQVPAYGVFPPTLRPKAPELKVNSRETIENQHQMTMSASAPARNRISKALIPSAPPRLPTPIST